MSEYYCSHIPACCPELARVKAELERLKVNPTADAIVRTVEDRDRWRELAGKMAYQMQQLPGPCGCGIGAKCDFHEALAAYEKAVGGKDAV